MSLRDAASQCLRSLGPYLSNRYTTERDFLVNKTILGIIASGIRDKKSDQVQQEAVVFLGYMVYLINILLIVGNNVLHFNSVDFKNKLSFSFFIHISYQIG